MHTHNRGAAPNELGVQVLTLVPLVYICVCTYFALFRVNAFDYNKLLPRCARAVVSVCLRVRDAPLPRRVCCTTPAPKASPSLSLA